MARIPEPADKRSFPIARPVAARPPLPGTQPAAISREEAEGLLIDNLGLLEHVVRCIARRYFLPSDEADELLSGICLKLVANDYEVLRRFRHRSSLRTYLLVVVQRYFLDTRTATWGKWRPCREALRRGPIAITLDRLMTRDGLSFDQACEMLRTDYGVTLSQAELIAMADSMPHRQGRRFVGEEHLLCVASDDPSPDEVLNASTLGAQREQIRDALRRIVAGLPADDRRLLSLRFREGHTVAAVSDRLQLEQKPLYRRLALILRRLRDELETLGVTRDQVLAVLSGAAGEIAGILPEFAPAQAPIRMR